MEGKIKNNVKEQPDHFSWKMKFPKGVLADTVNEADFMLLNKKLERMQCEFVVYGKENAVLISPKTPYKKGDEYFFWAKVKKKEICCAFLINDDNQLQTFEQKTSMEKLNQSLQNKRKREGAAVEGGEA